MGKTLNWNKAHGALVAVNGLDCGDSGICEYAFLKSSFEKYRPLSVEFMKSSGSILSSNTSVHPKLEGQAVFTANTRCPSIIFQCHHNRSGPD